MRVKNVLLGCINSLQRLHTQPKQNDELTALYRVYRGGPPPNVVRVRKTLWCIVAFAASRVTLHNDKKTHPPSACLPSTTSLSTALPSSRPRAAGTNEESTNTSAMFSYSPFFCNSLRLPQASQRYRRAAP